MDAHLERARLYWPNPRNPHTGPQRVIAATEAGHMSAPDYAPNSSKRFFLHQRGRPDRSMTIVSPGLSVGPRTCSTWSETHDRAWRRRAARVLSCCRFEERPMPALPLARRVPT